MPRQQVTFVLKQPVFGIDAGIVESGVGRGDLQVSERAQTLSGTRRGGTGRWAGRRRHGTVSCHQRCQSLAVRCGEGRLAGQKIVQLGGIMLQVVKLRVGSFDVLIISPAQAAQRRPSKFVVRVGAFAVNVARRRIPALGELQQAVTAESSPAPEIPGSSARWAQHQSVRREPKHAIRNSELAPNFDFRVSSFGSPPRAANGR